MQTVASLSERLEMTAEQAVEKLRYMLFDVESVESVVSDEQIDLLIDIDDDPELMERVRNEKLKERDREAKRRERQRAAAKKGAATRKAAAKKRAAAKEDVSGDGAGEIVTEAVVEILPPLETVGAEAEEAGDAGAAVAEPRPVVEIIRPGEEAAEEGVSAESAARSAELPRPAREKAKPSIVIGSAVDREERSVEIVRADGTLLEAPEVDAEALDHPLELDLGEEEEEGLLAEAERRQEEEELRRTRLTGRSAVRPDPAVVAEVKRKAAERARKKLSARPEPKKAPVKPVRKKQKKVDRAREEERMRRGAAAAVREVLTGGPRKRRRKRSREEFGFADEAEVETRPQSIEMEESITVEELAAAMDVGVNDIILDLMDLEIMATKNQTLSFDVVRRLGELHGFEVRSVIPEEDEILAEEPDDPAELRPRAPVITVMGHVDHGKTTLLDRIRKSNVAEGEAGGITQHIAAYDVQTPNGRVVFLDTPGHEAFTHMRARGAQATDIVVLVVAADDGVMPQTIEAIDHARAAEVPIVVAVNKIDKPEAQPERIRQELTRFDLVDEKWGGKTIMKDISAKTGRGIDELLELLALEAELLELKANPNKPARGVIIESEISRGQGPVAWVLVQAGTLCVGDVYLAGIASGRVRSLINARGENMDEVGPSTPVLVTGFALPPDAGDQFIVVKDERVARNVAEKRMALSRQKEGRVRRVTLEDFHAMMVAGGRKELNVILKADVQGSVDVLESNLAKSGNEEVRVNLVHAGVGGINESDVLLASASDAVIIGFHVTANPRAQKLAETESVDIRTYRVIYEAIEDVRKALEGLLAPETREVVAGHAEIRQVFRSSALGNIAGCYVSDGEVGRGMRARLVRNGAIVYEGKIGSLRREREDTRTVLSGFECGIKLENFEDIKEGDVIETFRLEEVAKTLA